jgi:hypothetical protein
VLEAPNKPTEGNLRLTITNEGKQAISAWGSDSGGVTIEPGQTNTVWGKSCSCHGSDSDGQAEVAGPGFPTAGDGQAG